MAKIENITVVEEYKIEKRFYKIYIGQMNESNFVGKNSREKNVGIMQQVYRDIQSKKFSKYFLSLNCSVEIDEYKFILIKDKTKSIKKKPDWIRIIPTPMETDKTKH